MHRIISGKLDISSCIDNAYLFIKNKNGRLKYVVPFLHSVPFIDVCGTLILQAIILHTARKVKEQIQLQSPNIAASDSIRNRKLELKQTGVTCAWCLIILISSAPITVLHVVEYDKAF